MRPARGPRLLVFARPGALAGGLAGVVFGARERDRGTACIAVALAVYVAIAAAIWARPHRRLSTPPPAPPDMTVELLAPRTAAAPPPVAARVEARAPSRARPAAVHAAPAPSRAAEVIAREAPPDEPADLTDLSIATGTAARFEGGATASRGASAHAVTGAIAGGAPDAPGLDRPDLSSPVSISETEWSDCAWPPEADSLGIDQQVVSMRAVADADGAFESAEILNDPGHGFSAALLACARRHGFVAARDRAGRPVRAHSGVLRFTFTR